MIVEIGHYALVLALALALAQSVVPLAGSLRRDAAMMAMAPPVALLQFAFIVLAFASLILSVTYRIRVVLWNT